MILVAFGAPEHDFWLVKPSQRAKTLHSLPSNGDCHCRERLSTRSVMSTKDDSFSVTDVMSPET